MNTPTPKETLESILKHRIPREAAEHYLKTAAFAGETVYFRLNVATIEGFLNYLYDGVPCGGFVQSVICNDLEGAVCKADSTNREGLYWTVCILHNLFPREAHGSEQAYDNWLELHRKAKEEE